MRVHVFFGVVEDRTVLVMLLCVCVCGCVCVCTCLMYTLAGSPADDTFFRVPLERKEILYYILLRARAHTCNVPQFHVPLHDGRFTHWVPGYVPVPSRVWNQGKIHQVLHTRMNYAHLHILSLYEVRDRVFDLEDCTGLGFIQRKCGSIWL